MNLYKYKIPSEWKYNKKIVSILVFSSIQYLVNISSSHKNFAVFHIFHSTNRYSSIFSTRWRVHRVIFWGVCYFNSTDILKIVGLINFTYFLWRQYYSLFMSNFLAFFWIATRPIQNAESPPIGRGKGGGRDLSPSEGRTVLTKALTTLTLTQWSLFWNWILTYWLHKNQHF